MRAHRALASPCAVTGWPTPRRRTAGVVTWPAAGFEVSASASVPAAAPFPASADLVLLLLVPLALPSLAPALLAALPFAAGRDFLPPSPMARGDTAAVTSPAW